MGEGYITVDIVSSYSITNVQNLIHMKSEELKNSLHKNSGNFTVPSVPKRLQQLLRLR